MIVKINKMSPSGVTKEGDSVVPVETGTTGKVHLTWCRVECRESFLEERQKKKT